MGSGAQFARRLGLGIGLVGWLVGGQGALPGQEAATPSGDRAVGRVAVEELTEPPSPGTAANPLEEAFNRRRSVYRRLLATEQPDPRAWLREFPLERSGSNNILTAPTREEWALAAPQAAGYFARMLAALPPAALGTREAHTDHMDMIAAFHVAGFPEAAKGMLQAYFAQVDKTPEVSGHLRDEVLASIMGARAMVAVGTGEAEPARQAIGAMLRHYAAVEAQQPNSVRITADADYGGLHTGMAMAVFSGQPGVAPAALTDTIEMPMSRSLRHIPVFYYSVDGHPARAEATMRASLAILANPMGNTHAAWKLLTQAVQERQRRAGSHLAVDATHPDPFGDQGILTGSVGLTLDRLGRRIDWLVELQQGGTTIDPVLSRALLPMAVTNWAENYASRFPEIDIAERRLIEALEYPWPDELASRVCRMYDMLPFVGQYPVDTYNGLITDILSKIGALGYNHTSIGRPWQERVREVRAAGIRPLQRPSAAMRTVLEREYGPSELFLARLQLLDSLEFRARGQVVQLPAWFAQRRAALYLEKLPFPPPDQMSPRLAERRRQLEELAAGGPLFLPPAPPRRPNRPEVDFSQVRFQPTTPGAMVAEMRAAYGRASDRVRQRDGRGAIAESVFRPSPPAGQVAVLDVAAHSRQLTQWLRGLPEGAIVSNMGQYRNWTSFDLGIRTAVNGDDLRGAALHNAYIRTMMTRGLGLELVATRSAFYRRARRLVLDFMANPDSIWTMPYADAVEVLQSMPVFEQATAIDTAFARLRETELQGDIERLRAVATEVAGTVAMADGRADAALEAMGRHPLGRLAARTDLAYVDPGNLRVEYLRHREVSFTAEGIKFGQAYRYSCLVVAPRAPVAGREPMPPRGLHYQDIHYFDLGPAQPIDEAARAFAVACANPATPIPDLTALGTTLRALVWDAPSKAIEPQRDGVYILPDGALAFVPFAVLPLPDGRHLVEQLEICYATTARDLKPPDVRTSQAGTRLLVGDVDFDAPLGAQDADYSTAGGQRAIGMVRVEQLRPAAGAANAGVGFGRLPGSGREVEAIAGTLGRQGRVRRVSGRDATKASLLRVRSPEILHLATHGVYFTGRAQTNDSLAKLLGTDLQLADTNNPMLLSGIALSGANAMFSATPRYDGFLTAHEISELDLTGTRLVVVAACETALGEASDGEGVVGLRRGFAIAGAETLVTALWKVPDQETKDLMVILYNAYGRLDPNRGAGRSLSLAQREFLHLHRDQPTAHPYFWGAFVANVTRGDMWSAPGSNPTFGQGWSALPTP